VTYLDATSLYGAAIVICGNSGSDKWTWADDVEGKLGKERWIAQ
jgi:hypothetical protein